MTPISKPYTYSGMTGAALKSQIDPQ